MNIYRTLLWWLALAVLGALAWDWLATDPGQLVLRIRGQTITTTVAFGLAAWGLLWFALWALWWLVRLPLRAWRRHARRQARLRLVSGLEALQQGRWQRAESLLAKAAGDADLRTAALRAARRAAAERGDSEAAAGHQAALLAHDAQAGALDQAERLLEQGRADEALAALATIAEKSLPPRGQRLKLDALLASGRGHEAMGLLNGLRREQALAPERLAELEWQLGAASLAESPGVDALLQRWQALPRRLQELPGVVSAFARRAAGLGLEREAAEALADALRQGWDEALVAQFGRLPTGDGDSRLAVAEAWLATQPNSPALLLALGRLCREQRLWGKAQDYLHRALAQGAGADAWETLGQVYSVQGDAERAQVAYANALRLGRNEPVLALGGRSLREQIADSAVAEQRNEHGLPLLPR